MQTSTPCRRYSTKRPVFCHTWQAHDPVIGLGVVTEASRSCIWQLGGANIATSIEYSVKYKKLLFKYAKYLQNLIYQFFLNFGLSYTSRKIDEIYFICTYGIFKKKRAINQDMRTNIDNLPIVLTHLLYFNLFNNFVLQNDSINVIHRPSFIAAL